MARPERNNVDYFPFYCEEGSKMFYIEETYGNDGFATFVKILRELAKTNYHYLDLSKNTTKMFLSAKCKIQKEVLIEIIQDLVDLEKFDKQLWEENQIIWCQDFIDSIKDAYDKRKNECINKNQLVALLTSKGILKHSKSVSKPSLGKTKNPDNTQTILEETKEDKTILEKSKLTEVDTSSIPLNEFEHYEIALNIQKKIRETILESGGSTKKLDQANYKTWVDPIRLMMTTDGITRAQINKAARFGLTDDFWKKNILSTANFRKHFDKLILDSNGKQKNGTIAERFSKEYLDKLAADISGM